MVERAGAIGKNRLHALTDGVFAFAMTLLVINLSLPDDFKPANAGELIAALRTLEGPFIVYVVTFAVLASFWLGRAGAKNEPEEPGAAYVWAVLLLLFFVTCMPFSMMIAARFDLAPGITGRHPEILGKLLAQPDVYGNPPPDVHPAAVTIEHGLTLCSADADFARFPDLRWLNPLLGQGGVAAPTPLLA